MAFFGLLVAVAAGLILLPVAIALDPTARKAATALAHFAFFSIIESSADGSPVFAAIELTRFVWSARRCLHRAIGDYRFSRRNRPGALLSLVCRRNGAIGGLRAVGRARRFQHHALG